MSLADLELEPELLWLVVVGPGFGESILIAVPGGYFIAIDSLRRLDMKVDINPALEFLEARGAELDLIALTHPHEDHVLGFTQLLDRRKSDAPVGCISAYLPNDRQWRRHHDAARVRDRSAIDTALNRIEEIWRTEPPSRWPMLAGTRKTVGEAELEVLFPAEIPANKPRNPNSLSTPMVLRWHACRFLLGADLPSTGWRKIERLHDGYKGKLSEAAALKASHHGSGAAQHHLAIGVPPPKDRVCLLTPFNRGRKLPDYGDQGGVERLLCSHRRVGVTNVPSQGRGAESPRAKLMPRRAAFGSLTLDYEDLPASPREAWIAIGFDADGTEVLRHSGDAAGIVV